MKSVGTNPTAPPEAATGDSTTTAAEPFPSSAGPGDDPSRGLLSILTPLLTLLPKPPPPLLPKPPPPPLLLRRTKVLLALKAPNTAESVRDVGENEGEGDDGAKAATAVAAALAAASASASASSRFVLFPKGSSKAPGAEADSDRRTSRRFLGILRVASSSVANAWPCPPAASPDTAEAAGVTLASFRCSYAIRCAPVLAREERKGSKVKIKWSTSPMVPNQRRRRERRIKMQIRTAQFKLAKYKCGA
jgi:hypothetical protein